MGIAADTVGLFLANPGATLSAAEASPGDSLTVRNGAAGALIHLDDVIRAGAATGELAIKSPLLYDNTYGFRFGASTSPQKWTIPHQDGLPLMPQDDLTALLTGGTAETDIGALMIYYENLPGASARLHSWGDIAGNIETFKTVKVACTSSATIGTWVDTVITTTEDLLKANRDHAILGYMTDAEVAVVGVKATDTSNLRISGPGYVAVEDTSDYFIRKSNDSGRPYIPVFNSANKSSTYVSVLHNTASLAVNVYLVLALLSQNLAS